MWQCEKEKVCMCMTLQLSKICLILERKKEKGKTKKCNNILIFFYRNTMQIWNNLAIKLWQII